jgi:replication fork clamp-binding protein CrfC
LWVTDELYINHLNSDLFISLTLDKNYKLEISAPSILTSIMFDGNPNIKAKISAENLLLLAEITNNGFIVTNSSITVGGSATVVDDKNATKTIYNLTKNEIQYNNNKFIFDLFVEDDNKNIYTLKVILTINLEAL